MGLKNKYSIRYHISKCVQIKKKFQTISKLDNQSLLNRRFNCLIDIQLNFFLNISLKRIYLIFSFIHLYFFFRLFIQFVCHVWICFCLLIFKMNLLSPNQKQISTHFELFDTFFFFVEILIMFMKLIVLHILLTFFLFRNVFIILCMFIPHKWYFCVFWMFEIYLRLNELWFSFLLGFIIGFQWQLYCLCPIPTIHKSMKLAVHCVSFSIQIFFLLRCIENRWKIIIAIEHPNLHRKISISSSAQMKCIIVVVFRGTFSIDPIYFFFFLFWTLLFIYFGHHKQLSGL